MGIAVDTSKLLRNVEDVRREVTGASRFGGTRGGELIKEIAFFDAAQNKTVFATQGAASGDPWKPLSKKYKRRKRKRFPGGRKILAATGELRRSLTQQSHAERITSVQLGGFLKLGTKNRTAIWHQDGTENEDGSERMPARPVVRKSEVQEQHLSIAAAKALLRGIARGGGPIGRAFGRAADRLRADPRAS